MSKETPPDSVPDNCVHCGCARHHHGMKAHACYLCESLLHISKDSRHFGKWHRSLNCWRAEATTLKEQLRHAHAALRGLTETLASHDAISYDCNRSGVTYCKCLDSAMEVAKEALASAPDGEGEG